MANPLHIIFCGTSSFAIPSLEALARDSAFVVDLVITQPDKPIGRKQVLTPPPVKQAADQLGLKVAQPQKLNDAYAELIRNLPPPDYLIVVSYGQIIAQSILDSPRIAPLNVHASLLPQWRGASPIHQAILSGQTQTGVTIQKMVKELDAGPVVARRAISITARETTETLHERLATISAPLLTDTLKEPLRAEPQNESRITVCRKLKREDGLVDPTTMTAEEIDRKVRALVPWPGVTMTIEGTELKILKTDLSEQPEATPLECKDNTTLYLIEIQVPSKKPVSGKAWATGRKSTEPK